MQTVVVGGQARKVGKTSVVAGLIRGLRGFGWTAVKITQHHQDLSMVRGGDFSEGKGFVITEEQAATARGDTRRYLAAGARRALWMQVRPGSLAEALPALFTALEGDSFVMFESTSILEFLDPEIFLMVFDARVRAFKSSARKYLRRADALVSIGSLGSCGGPALGGSSMRAKPVFPVARPGDSSPDLCRFVRRKLHLPATASRAASGA